MHDEEYTDAFLTGALPEAAVRRIGLRPWTPSIIPRTLRLIGGSLCALQDVLRGGGIAGNLAGGTHHAFRGEGSGYCIFNDLAICALRALETPAVRRVLILDLDVHQGDGTAALLAGHPDVYTVSFHGEKNFPFCKQQSDLDVAFPDGTGDRVYLEALEDCLVRLELKQFDLVFYQAGVDGLAEDRLGRLRLTRAGLDRRNRMVLDACRGAAVPVVVFMGGGYADPIDATVAAFADLFDAAAEYSALAPWNALSHPNASR